MKKLLLLFGVVTCWFTTSAQLTAPFTESFNGTTIPSGWMNTSSNTSTNANWKFSGTPGNPSMAGSSYNPPVILDHTQNGGSIAWSDGSTPVVADCGLMTDSIDITALNSLWLEFWYYSNNVTNAGDNNTLYVNFYDGTQWNDSIWGYSGDGVVWQYGAVDLSTFTTSGKVLFEFVVDQTTAGTAFYNDILLDDITVTNVPTCPLPLNLTVSNVTSSGADVSWSAVTAATNGYEIIYGPAGFDPSSGGTSASSATTSYTIPGLSGATEYDAYVIADCGAANGVSDTAGPIAFTTLCVPFTAPYYNGFENDALDVPPLCWEDYETNSASFVEVEDFTGTSAPYAGSQALYLYSSSGTPTDELLAFTPEFSDLTAGDKQIRFFANSDDPVSQLIIGTADTNAGSFSFTAMDTITFSQPDTYEEIIIPITAANGYNGTDRYVVFAHNMGATFDYIRIDEFNYEDIPPCGKVTQVNVTSSTINSFDLIFNSDGSNFDIEWGPAGFGQGTGCTANINTTSGTFDNNTDPGCVSTLQPNTFYDVYVRNNCTAGGNGVSIWEGPITFKTACAAFTAPYFMDFENEALDVPPVCWRDFETNAASFVEVEDFTGTSSPYAGSQALYLYSSSATTSDDLYAITPRFSDLSAGDKRINLYANSDGPNARLYVGTADTNAGTINFNPIDTIDFAAPDTYEQVIVEFTAANGYNGTDDYIVLAHSLEQTFQYVRIDNFQYEDIPACVPPLISTLSVSAIGNTSADLNWGSGSQGVKTYVEVGALGFTPGAGAAIITDSVQGGVDTYSATGLTSNSNYEFYIQDSCLTGLSPWVGPFSFQTACALSAATLPLFEGFENYSGTVYTGSAQFCNPTYAWNFDGSGNSDSRLRLSAGTGYYNSGIQAFTLDQAAFQGGRITNYLVLSINLSNYTTAAGIELGFSYMNHGQESDPDNRVWVRGDITDNWVEIFDLDANSSGTGVYDSVTNIDIVGPLAAAGQTVGANTQIRFGQNGQTTSSSLTFSDGYTFDDVNLRAVTCPTPSDLGLASILDTNAVLDWNANSSASGYEVWFGPQGFYQGTQTVGGVRNYPATNSLSVDTLTGNTCYEYLVRYICGPGDTSSYAGPYQFCTPCSPFFAPYVQGFEGMTTGQTPDCFSAVLVGSNTTLSAAEVYSFGTPRTGNNHIRFYNYNNSLTMLVSPLFGDITASDKRVTMYARETFADGEELIIGTSPSQNPSLGDFNPLDTFTMSTNDQYIRSNIDAANGYNGTDQFVALLHGNTATFNTIYIDDFVYEFIPSCIEPIAGQTLFADITTADLTFVPGGASNFDIAFGPTGFTPYGPNSTIQSFTNDTVTITGLTSNTTYEWYVRDSCAVGDVSTWTGPYSFTTACNAFVAPYIADFESNTLGYYQGQDNCWTIENTVDKTSATSGYGWELRNTAQTSSGSTTGADRDNTLAPATGGQFFNVDGSYGSAGDSSMLISPIVDISGLVAPELEYHIHRYGTILGDFYVDIYDGSNWINGVHSYTNQSGMQSAQSDPYTDTIIDLAPYIGTTNFRVRFRTVSNGCCASDNSFDDVRISDPIPGNLDLINGEFISEELCLSTNDSILLQVVSTEDSIDFAVNPLTGSYDVTGPINTSGSINISTGGLAKDDTLDIYIGNIDLSIPGTYVLDAQIDSNAVNVFLNRDSISGESIVIPAEFLVTPSADTLATSTDSVSICAQSAFFGGLADTSARTAPPLTANNGQSGVTFEVEASKNIDLVGLLNIFSTGATSANLWMRTGGVQHSTGAAPNISAANGWTQVVTGGMITGANNTTPVFMDFGSTSVSLVANQRYGFFIDGATRYQTGTAGDQTTYSDGTVTIYVDDDASYGGGIPTPTFNPRRFLGAVVYDNPVANGFTWSLNGNVVDTLPCTTVGPGLAPGNYQYIANYSNACGNYSDTVDIFVPSCQAPVNLSASTVGANDVDVTWDSTGTGTSTFDMEYGPVGYAPGNGTLSTITGDSTRITGLTGNVCVDVYIRSNCGGNLGAWVGPVKACPSVTLCSDDFDQYAIGGITDQSALFIPWQGVASAAGDAEVSTAQSLSGAQSLNITEQGPAGVTDVVAYFDTISSGAWEISFELYVPTGNNAYFNIQQNHDLTAANNLWGGEVYFQGNGTAEVQYSTGTTVAGTFTYTQGQWNTVSTFIDLGNDSIWFELNGTSTGVGYNYSLANAGQPLQFNGVNFFSGVLAGDNTPSNYYVDDFCVAPSTSNCPAPTALNVLGVGCDTARVGWTSAANTGSFLEYGPTGFTPGNGTLVAPAVSPYTITGLATGTDYDFYVLDTCAGGTTSSLAGPVTFTTESEPTADFSFTLGSATATDLTVTFDASASVGANSYAWDFGDGNSGGVVNPTNDYTANGTYIVTLTVTGDCGTDTHVDTVLIGGIGMTESLIHHSLNMYPNPATNMVTISFSTDSDHAKVSLLSVDGKKLRVEVYQGNQGEVSENWDVSDLPDGVYMVRIESEEGMAIRRLIIE